MNLLRTLGMLIGELITCRLPAADHSEKHLMLGESVGNEDLVLKAKSVTLKQTFVTRKSSGYMQKLAQKTWIHRLIAHALLLALVFFFCSSGISATFGKTCQSSVVKAKKDIKGTRNELAGRALPGNLPDFTPARSAVFLVSAERQIRFPSDARLLKETRAPPLHSSVASV